jgi:hypothetical protein
MQEGLDLDLNDATTICNVYGVETERYYKSMTKNSKSTSGKNTVHENPKMYETLK